MRLKQWPESNTDWQGLAGQKGWVCLPNPDSYGSQALSNSSQLMFRPLLCLQVCQPASPNLDTTTLDIRWSICSHMICRNSTFPTGAHLTPHPLGWPCLAPEAHQWQWGYQASSTRASWVTAVPGCHTVHFKSQSCKKKISFSK